MGFFSDFLAALFSGAGGTHKSRNDRYRQTTGRYGKKGTYRKERNGDRVGRDKSSGRYTNR